MKHKLSGLVFVSLILTSCQTSAPTRVIFPLENSKILLTSEQLTQDEYCDMVEHIAFDDVVMGFDFSLSFKSIGGQEFDITTTGSWNQNYSNENEESATFITKVWKNTWVASSYYIRNPAVSGYYVEYLTFDGKLECGLLKKRYDTGRIDYYYNPDLPISYYETKYGVFQTDPFQYRAMQYERNIFINGRVSFYGPVPNATEYQNGDIHLIDKPIYSHELTRTQLIIREQRKVRCTGISTPDEDARYNYYNSLIGEGRPYYLNGTYYYNYRNGTLSKYESSFCLPKYSDVVEDETVGTCIVEYKNRHGKEKSEAMGYVKKFLNFKGVTEGPNPEQQQYEE